MRFAGQVIAVGILAVIAAGVAYAYSKNQPTEYTAVAQLGYGANLQPELQLLGSAFEDIEIDEEEVGTEARRVDSYDIAVKTAKRSPRLGYSADEIDARIEVTAFSGAWLIYVIAREDTPARAARLAQAYTDAYLACIRARERRRLGMIERALEKRLAEISPPSAAGLLGATLRDQLSHARLIRRVGVAAPEVIENARAAGAASNDNTTRNVLFGLLFGIVAGIGLVALRSESGSRGAVAAAKRLSRRG